MRIKGVMLFFLATASLNAAAGGVDAGKELATDRNKGNCIACHAIPSDPTIEAAGNIGPALADVKKRYPDRAKLRAQIWDATVANPDSVMPPFGRNKILTDKEIDEVADYIMGL